MNIQNYANSSISKSEFARWLEHRIEDLREELPEAVTIDDFARALIDNATVMLVDGRGSPAVAREIRTFARRLGRRGSLSV